MTHEIVIVHHGGCPDGISAAWAVWKALRDLPGVNFTFAPATHGEMLNVPVTDRDVIMVDFCYGARIMETLRRQCRSLLVIDHHRTALDTLASWPSAQPERWRDYYRGVTNTPVMVRRLGYNHGTFIDMNYSGAALAWEFFHPGKPMPRLLAYVQDRDLWTHKLPSTRAVSAWVSTLPVDVALWEVAVETFEKDPYKVLTQGDAVLAYTAKAIGELVAAGMAVVTIRGHQVPICNVPHHWGSDAAEFMQQTHPGSWPFVGYYYDAAATRVFGLRSGPDGLDVAEIARTYGGGGHKHAAGFRVPLGWRGDDHAG